MSTTRPHIDGIFILFGTLFLIGAWFVMHGLVGRSGLASTQRRFQTARIGEKEMQVVVSDTSAQIEQGLSDRTEIGADGMLFLLPERQLPTFWMYHMRFPLDFIWIDGDTIVDLHERVPVPPGRNAPSELVPTIRPKQAVTAVLEAPSGFISQKKVQIGQPFLLQGVSKKENW